MHVTKSRFSVVLAMMMLLPSAAMAQDGFDFGSDGGSETSASADGFDFGGGSATTVKKEIDKSSRTYALYEQAVQSIGSKKEMQAAQFLYEALQTQDDTAAAMASQLNFELGKVLYGLGFYQSALSRLEAVLQEGSDSAYFLPTLEYLVLAGRELPGEPRRYSRIYENYLNKFPQEIPAAMQSEVGWLLGMAAYEESKLDDAIFFFGAVSQESDFYPKARYVEGVTNVRRYDGNAAVASFKDVLRWLDGRKSKGLTKEQASLYEMTVAALARVFYQVGHNMWIQGEREKAVSNWRTSIKYYAYFTRNSAQWLDSLFEASWTYYRVGSFGKSLGLLLTLNSPYFRDLYYPEAMLLQAQIYYTNCHYDRVMDILTNYKEQYGSLKDSMDKLVATLFQPEEVFNFLIESKTKEYDPMIRQLLNAALEDKALKRAMNYINIVDAEADKIRQDRVFANSPLGVAMLQELGSVKALSSVEAGKKGKQRLERVQEELVRLSNMALDIEIETTEKYAQNIGKEQEVQQASLDRFKKEVKEKMSQDDEHILWNFDGEYWKDELGYYWYGISSKCGR